MPNFGILLCHVAEVTVGQAPGLHPGFNQSSIVAYSVWGFEARFLLGERKIFHNSASLKIF